MSEYSTAQLTSHARYLADEGGYYDIAQAMEQAAVQLDAQAARIAELEAENATLRVDVDIDALETAIDANADLQRDVLALRAQNAKLQAVADAAREVLPLVWHRHPAAVRLDVALAALEAK